MKYDGAKRYSKKSITVYTDASLAVWGTIRVMYPQVGHAFLNPRRIWNPPIILFRDALEILLFSWRVRRGKRYNSHIKRLVGFCYERQTDPIQATTEMGTEFLTKYFKIEVVYSLVNSARSALSSIIKPVCNIPFGKSPLVRRLLKGVFNIRSPLPKYITTWGVTWTVTWKHYFRD